MMDFMLSTLNNKLTMRMKCICGKEYKNLRGLRIYQARMRYLEKESQSQFTGPQPAGIVQPGFTKNYKTANKMASSKQHEGMVKI